MDLTTAASDSIISLPVVFHNLGDLFQYNSGAPMLFSTGFFWFLFILFLPIYIMLKNSKAKMTIFVIGFSLYFYYKSSGWFFLMLIGTSLIDWLLSWAIFKQKKKGARLALMWLSVAISLSILGYFKYSNFFLMNWNAMVRGNFQPLEIILPVGISFYTFQSISYVVDIYRRRIVPTRSWFDYLFFLSFFPALVAGPIVRADYFLPQLKKNLQATPPMIWEGLWLILIGILKKAVFADYIAQYNDLIFESPGVYSGFQSLMGMLGYTMQVYCDFSGYSDMSIGLALIMGFRLGINFDAPYKSRNISQFWRKWHISLSSWLRDYVYIPLGGSRKGVIRTYVNNFLTMLLAGLWHGASWTFVVWGAFQGFGLAVHKAFKPVLDKIPNNTFWNIFFGTITFIYLSFLLVLFRSATIPDAIQIYESIFTQFDIREFPQFCETRDVWCIMMLILFVVHFIPKSWDNYMQDIFIKSPWIIKLLCFLIVVQLVIEFMSAEVQPFIYFQF